MITLCEPEWIFSLMGVIRECMLFCWNIERLGRNKLTYFILFETLWSLTYHMLLFQFNDAIVGLYY